MTLLTGVFFAHSITFRSLKWAWDKDSSDTGELKEISPGHYVAYPVGR
ncbi:MULTISPECIES: hypothetical protein [Paenibacillus]|nr:MULTISPECIES: hypothetical protein [Paenibacillus]CCC83235.1 hypothetical protein PPM_0298 [Paenibacillus polymyxa M1]KAF6562143.1 hypothetical protein G9G63_19665 [Paenibacillus sp. EKM202P]KAF6566455.1 hypothetical protein G9G64_18690 [Paenibacillus sp. EKM207P]MBU9708971.1 hypothetical protein [Paenibacillus sp. AK121]MEE4569074.1 hypothetical protein [Paenibacillus polymyxa]